MTPEYQLKRTALAASALVIAYLRSRPLTVITPRVVGPWTHSAPRAAEADPSPKPQPLRTPATPQLSAPKWAAEFLHSAALLLREDDGGTMSSASSEPDGSLIRDWTPTTWARRGATQ